MSEAESNYFEDSSGWIPQNALSTEYSFMGAGGWIRHQSSRALYGGFGCNFCVFSVVLPSLLQLPTAVWLFWSKAIPSLSFGLGQQSFVWFCWQGSYGKEGEGNIWYIFSYFVPQYPLRHLFSKEYLGLHALLRWMLLTSSPDMCLFISFLPRGSGCSACRAQISQTCPSLFPSF